MKTNILPIEGKKLKEIKLPECFSEPLREDIILKVYETSKSRPLYAPALFAGKLYSASGKIRHARGKWKTAYGYGISRVPRKIMTRKGSRFYWVGATVASTRGGRAAHPPKLARRKLKINKKEKSKALRAAIAATASREILEKKYPKTKEKIKKIGLPVVFEEKISKLKTKEIYNTIKKIFGTIKILIIKTKKENFKTKISALNVEDISKKESILLLAPGGKPGALAIYTENAIKELEKLR